MHIFRGGTWSYINNLNSTLNYYLHPVYLDSNSVQNLEVNWKIKKAFSVQF